MKSTRFTDLKRYVYLGIIGEWMVRVVAERDEAQLEGSSIEQSLHVVTHNTHLIDGVVARIDYYIAKVYCCVDYLGIYLEVEWELVVSLARYVEAVYRIFHTAVVKVLEQHIAYILREVDSRYLGVNIIQMELAEEEAEKAKEKEVA